MTKCLVRSIFFIASLFLIGCSSGKVEMNPFSVEVSQFSVTSINSTLDLQKVTVASKSPLLRIEGTCSNKISIIEVSFNEGKDWVHPAPVECGQNTYTVNILLTAASAEVQADYSSLPITAYVRGRGDSIYTHSVAFVLNANTKVITLTPEVKTLNPGSALSLNADGGSEPYSFDVYYGNGSIVSAGTTGNYQAPTAEGTAIVRVQDNDGNIAYTTLQIIDSPVIQPSSKTLAVGNKFPFSILNGKAPYVFSIASGEGTINTSTGEFIAASLVGTAVVRATDAAGRSAEANITINAALSFTENNVYIEKNNTYTPVVIGGVAPYKYSVVSGAGIIDKVTGVFTASSSIGITKIQVLDALGNVDIAVLNITNGLRISPSNALIIKNGSLLFSAEGGVPPYSYAVGVSGLGTISTLLGEYTAPAGTGTATVSVTDALGHTSDASVTITNNLSFSVDNLSLTVGNSFDVANVVDGGITPLTYVASSSQGFFSGSTYTAPNIAGTYTITVYDSQAPILNNITASVTVNSALLLLPSSVSVGVGGLKDFSVSGGVPPYTYSIQSGGGSINAGLYTAPDVIGNAVILATDARGNTATAAVTVHSTLAMIPSSKTLNSGEAFNFTASGGNAPYTFSLVSGSGEINSSSGLYTAPGSSGLVTVRVEDATGNRRDALITIVNPLDISPATLSLIKNGTITFTATGGLGPYSFSLTAGEGSVNATSGVFTAAAMVGTSTVRVTDSLGSIKEASITIYDGLNISPFTKNLIVNQSFIFTATAGIEPYTYSLVSGVGSISNTGLYSADTTGTAVVRVTDYTGMSSEATVTVNSALAIAPTSKILGVNNQFTFAATGGVPPYVFTVFSGNGTITTAGDFSAPATSTSAIVRVTDSANTMVDANITVTDPLSLSPATGVLAAGGTQNFTATGGVSPYTYSVTSGGGTFASSTYTAASITSGASVVVKVTDFLGNTANAALIVNPISVTITSPNNSELITASNKAAFTISGTCSESGRAINVSITGGVSATPNCASGAWSTTLNLTAVADGQVTITAAHTNINSVVTTSASVTLTKDASNPSVAITTPANASYTGASLTVTGACTKQGPVNITVTGGITANTNCESNSYAKTLDLSSAADGALTITVAHTDNAGNAATAATVNITKDTITPAITAFSVTNTSPTNSTTYNLNFTASDSPNQYCLLENSISLANCTWHNSPLPTSFTVNATNNDKILSAWVKDLTGNISARLDANMVALNTAVPAAPSAISLVTPAVSPNNITTPIVQVSGVNVSDTVSIYTDSACNSSNLKGSTTVTTGSVANITSSVLTDNTYTFYAKTVNIAGTSSSCSTANVNYALDTVVPTSPSITIDSGTAYTISATTQLALAVIGASEMYITNTAGCTSGGVYEAYSTSKSNWSLAVANTTNTVYVKFKDLAGNETACVSDSIIHDNIIPSVPSTLTLVSPNSSPSNITTPTIQVSTVTSGDSVKLFSNSNCTTQISSGTASGTTISLTTASLTAGTYSFYATSTDQAGNTSNCSTAMVAYVLDLTVATITNVTAVSNGTYAAGGTFTISVVFSKVVNVTGTPVLALTTGQSSHATYSSGSGSDTLVFAYTVANGDNSSDLTYTATSSLTLAGGTIKDNAGNDATLTLPTIGASGSLSYNRNTIIDTTAPTAPAITGDGIWMTTTATSPNITFTDGTDSGGSGMLKHQIQVVLGSDAATVIKTWSDFNTSGGAIADLNLSDGIQYKVQLKAIDNAGNESTIAISDGWKVDITPPSAPGSVTVATLSGLLTSSPDITWTASADAGSGSSSGISYYEVTIGTTAGGSQVQTWTPVANVTSTTVTGLSLSSGSTYYVSVRAIDNAGNISPVAMGSNGWLVQTVLSCPTGYIAVPALAGYSPVDFCVAKYEMKILGSGDDASGSQTYDSAWTAESRTSGTPWVSITRDQTIIECQALGTGYDLISNAQWQTIARNIADTAANWSGGGTAYSGVLNSGHSDGSPNSSLAASTDDNPYFGTSNTSSSWGSGSVATGDEQKRTHVLSNGNIIWDFAGNVWEWVKDNNSIPQGAEGYSSTFDGGDSRQTNYGNDSFCATPLAGAYCGMGYGWTYFDPQTGGGGAVMRGGAYNNGISVGIGTGITAGVFAVDLGWAGVNAIADQGFRCVFIP